MLVYMNEPIKVWEWDQAPDEFRSLSHHGGDEDWVALLPPHYSEMFIPWLEGSFGSCDVQETTLPNGYVVKIGAHA